VKYTKCTAYYGAIPPGPLQYISPLLHTAGYHKLNAAAHHFLTAGLATSTMATYSAGKRRYLQFCANANIQAIPATETTIMLFVAYLATTNISHASIKVYLSAVRHMHIMRGRYSEFDQLLTPRLQLTLRGIKKKQASTHQPRVRLPITISILHKIQSYLSSKAPSYSNNMLWAMCCLAFFGFLRVSELTIPSGNLYDSTIHLSLEDIRVDNRGNPRLLQVSIKQSKTDPFRRGIQLYIGATDRRICPIKAMLSYLAARGNRAGPLFITKQGRGITRQMFSSALDRLLTQLKLDCRHYNTHSFRIGAATTAVQAGIPESQIKMLGRWQSNAYQRYIKTPREELARLSRILSTNQQEMEST